MTYVCVLCQTMLSTDLDFLVSVEEVRMHLSSQLAARKYVTEQLTAKKRMVRCVSYFNLLFVSFHLISLQ